MALEKYAKWAISAATMWILFFIILFGGIIPKTSVIREYSCYVTSFNVEPRFECRTKCPLLSDSMILDADDAFELSFLIDKARELEQVEYYEGIPDRYEYGYGHHEKDPIPSPPDDRRPHCDDLERDTLKWYSPKLCLKAKFGFQDPLCPPESAICYTGHNWNRKCQLQCPLAYNVTVGLDVDHIGHIDKNRDLGTDAERYKSYKEEYVVGKKMTCQVVTNGKDVKWIDERLSHKAFAIWKWFLFTGSILLSLFCTVAAILHFITYREGNNRYSALAGDENDDDAVGIDVTRGRTIRRDDGTGVGGSGRA